VSLRTRQSLNFSVSQKGVWTATRSNGVVYGKLSLSAAGLSETFESFMYVSIGDNAAN
jgi:hypothetical protein